MVCADELGPAIPRTFPPAAGWSPDGHRIKAPLEYGRGTDKTWVYGALRIRDGTEVTCCAPSRNSDGWIRLLAMIAKANPRGPIRVVTDNLSSHSCVKVRGWLAGHRRIQQVFIPKAACWLNLAEGWWRLLRRAGVRRAVLCGQRRDRLRRAGRHRSAQRPRPAVGVGTTAATGPQPPPQVRVPPLRNAALVPRPATFALLRSAVASLRSRLH